MSEGTAAMLLIEDRPGHAAFFIHSLGKAALPAGRTVSRDGAESLDFIYGAA